MSEEETTEEQTTEAPAAEETVVDEVTEAPEAETVVEEVAEAPKEEAEKAEPEVVLHPKERRKLKRSTHSGEAGQPKSVQDRIEQRAKDRELKAKHRRTQRAKARERAAAKPKAPVAVAAVEESAPSTAAQKLRQGIVVSNKGDKSITVRIDMARRHKRYQKIIRTSSKLHAHDEKNEANIGDVVRVIECRPLSKTKRWRLVEILERAK